MAKLQDIRCRKTDLSLTGELEFDQNMLSVLMAIDEDKTLLQVANEVKLSGEEFKATLLKLYKLKLIEKVEEEIEYLDESYLSKIRTVLVELVGPLGETLLEDAALQLGVDMDKIPKRRAGDFLAAIAEEIPGEKQQKLFDERMAKSINTTG